MWVSHSPLNHRTSDLQEERGDQEPGDEVDSNGSREFFSTVESGPHTEPGDLNNSP